jgi:guanosine-3',5'-bis(diphosphate) 3'-pyrophosphohydrolase
MATKLALTQRWKKNLSDLLGPQTLSAIPDNETLVSELGGTLESYLDESAIFDIYSATIYGAEAHKGQKRKSGEDYIYHPIAVARILGEMRMDSRTIIAAILHDVVEDTDTTLEELANIFGEDVAILVDGVSKVSQLEQESREHAEAASFRKMFMAMAKDIRVIIIKLADRMHNMHTLESLDNDRKRRIARQTLEIYAPMANRLGMRELAQKLEDLSLLNLYPKRYNAIEKRIRASKRGRKPVISEVCKNISEKLAANGLEVEVNGREKNVYNIYRKMQRKRLLLKDVKDINAIRIITERRPDCYQALGIIHQLYKPRPESFKDYIAIPKVNGYQSLHTIVFGPFGQQVEVQIRSQSMHRTAEKGVASHWLYKTETTGEHAPQQLAQQWLNSFLEAQNMSSDSGEYLEHLKADLFPDEVYVFTPKGDIKRLPRGSTALDFAYAVHSDVGDHCIGALINEISVPLHEILSNGDHVEVKTSRKARPIPSWLDYAVTSKARASIRNYLNQQKDKESLKLGRKLLRTALSNQGYRRVRIPSEHKVNLLKHLKLTDWEQLLIDIGFGRRLPTLVAKQMIAESSTKPDKPDHNRSALTIEGTERLLINYANCCHPIPGDNIIGTTTSGRGLVVHRSNCANSKNIMRHPDNYFHLNWSEQTKGNFQVEVQVETRNEPGVLATVSNIIAEHNSNINNVSVDQHHRTSSEMTFGIEVENRDHLANILRQIHNEPTVIKVVRK